MNKTNLSTLENKTKTRCQVGNKAMKTKITNMQRAKERKKRKTEQICKEIEVDEKDLYTLKTNCKGKEQQERQAKEEMQRKYNRFKKLKIKIIKKRK